VTEMSIFLLRLQKFTRMAEKHAAKTLEIQIR